MDYLHVLITCICHMGGPSWAGWRPTRSLPIAPWESRRPASVDDSGHRYEPQGPKGEELAIEEIV